MIEQGAEEPGDDDLAGAYVASAMFALAAACEPPALRPDCPYSVELSGGVRTCRQQCFDLLTARGIDPPGPDLVPLPLPESRPDLRPFDASQMYMVERGRHPWRWSVPSLMWALKQHLTRTTVGVAGPGDPQREMELCLMELARRGFDVDEIVRLGLRDDIVQSIIIGAVLPPSAPTTITAESFAAAVPRTFPASAASVDTDRAAWVRLLDQTIAEDHSGATVDGDPLPFPEEEPAAAATTRQRIHAALRGTFHKRLQAWVASAPLQEIMAWTAPPAERFGLSDGLSEPTEARRDRARWTVERFVEPYYDKWSEKGLQQEFMWAKGKGPAACDERYMAQRPVRMQDLAETVAAAAISKPAGHERQRALLTVKAVELIKAGHRGPAAALMDASRMFDEDLPEPHNNYAFCVLPDDPQAALDALRHAQKLGYNRTVSVCNRALCLAMLARPGEALAEARVVAARYHAEDSDGSFLWDAEAALDGLPPVLREDVSPRDYALDLAVAVASRAGDDASAAWWRSERDRLTVPPAA